MNWVKKGKIYTVSDHSEWMQSYAQVPTPVRLDTHYRIYFASRHYKGKEKDPISSIAYVDVDLNNPKKGIKSKR